jgi:Polyketide cyclase / dehydrase and lipid transport
MRSLVGLLVVSSWVSSTAFVPSLHSRQARLVLYSTSDNEDESSRPRIRNRVRELARNLVMRPMARPMPQAVAAVLREATMQAVDLAVDEVMHRVDDNKENNKVLAESKPVLDMNTEKMIREAFGPLEDSLRELEASLQETRKLLTATKNNAIELVQAVQVAAMAEAQGTSVVIAAAEEVASRNTIEEILLDNGVTDVSQLKFDDVDYGTSEMAPPFLGEDQCLVPGEPIVRVERAPENSRRIFAGIDIMAGVDDVWKILTNYERLQDVVPNLVVNEVLEKYSGSSQPTVDIEDESQIKLLVQQMKGAKLRQVGGAKVAGINFSARTTLEVREWPQGLPDFAHFNENVWQGQSRKDRAKDYANVKLKRYRFPRPFAVSSLPTRDISMQSVENDDGEFRLYQGVWRMQPLPGCSPPGKQAMRLTYAVEISPRAYLPVQLVEGRIVRDLCTNLEAIRDFVAREVEV